MIFHGTADFWHIIGNVVIRHAGNGGIFIIGNAEHLRTVALEGDGLFDHLLGFTRDG